VRKTCRGGDMRGEGGAAAFVQDLGATVCFGAHCTAKPAHDTGQSMQERTGRQHNMLYLSWAAACLQICSIS